MRLWIVALLALVSLCWATAPDNIEQTPVFTPVSTITVAIPGSRETVQRVPQLRSLTAGELAAINAYMAKHGGTGQCQNQRALRNSLEFLTAIDQSHFPLTREPKDYLADYQIFTQLFNRVDWYVNLPDQTIRLPALPDLGVLPMINPTEVTLSPVTDIRIPDIAPPCTKVVFAGGGGPVGQYRLGVGPWIETREAPAGLAWASRVRSWIKSTPPPPGPCPGPPDPPIDPPVPH